MPHTTHWVQEQVQVRGTGTGASAGAGHRNKAKWGACHSCMRICNYCTNRNNIIMEDEEHVSFGCPEYNTCRFNTLSYSIFQTRILKSY